MSLLVSFLTLFFIYFSLFILELLDTLQHFLNTFMSGLVRVEEIGLLVFDLVNTFISELTYEILEFRMFHDILMESVRP